MFFVIRLRSGDSVCSGGGRQRPTFQDQWDRQQQLSAAGQRRRSLDR